MHSRSALALIAALTTSGLAATTARAQPNPAAVTIESGSLLGETTDRVLAFKGIPYATAPVGDLRWRAPQAPAAWAGVRDARGYGPACPQPDWGAASAAAEPQSEDCLFLNVWRPAGPGRHLPVMVWLHGGGNTVGSGSNPAYAGRELAKQGVIVVTLNYRLGRLGFFSHPALLRADADHGQLGNYGLMDQLAALRWVQRNIRAFGGDPGNVTVFGQSGGGSYVNIWLTTPAARGLFAKAITQSSPGFVRRETIHEGEQHARIWAEAIGIHGDTDEALTRLRALPPHAFFPPSPRQTAGIAAVVDHRLIREDAYQAFAAGRESRVPLLIGHTDYDASYAASFPGGLVAKLGALGPDRLTRIRETYAAEADGSEDRLAGRFLSDMIMGASSRRHAARMTAKGGPTYLYSFEYVRPSLRQDAIGAAHGAELEALFGQAGLGGRRDESPADAQADEAVRREVQALWTSFARTGRPVSAKGAVWRPYRSRGGPTLIVARDGAIQLVNDYRRRQLDLAETIALERIGPWNPPYSP